MFFCFLSGESTLQVLFLGAEPTTTAGCVETAARFGRFRKTTPKIAGHCEIAMTMNIQFLLAPDKSEYLTSLWYHRIESLWPLLSSDSHLSETRMDMQRRPASIFIHLKQNVCKHHNTQQNVATSQDYSESQNSNNNEQYVVTVYSRLLKTKTEKEANVLFLSKDFCWKYLCSPKIPHCFSFPQTMAAMMSGAPTEATRRGCSRRIFFKKNIYTVGSYDLL